MRAGARSSARGLDPFNVSVGQAIRTERQYRGWTRLSPNYVARLERGELGPSLRVAVQLADALGVDVNRFVKRRP